MFLKARLDSMGQTVGLTVHADALCVLAPTHGHAIGESQCASVATPSIHVLWGQPSRLEKSRSESVDAEVYSEATAAPLPTCPPGNSDPCTQLVLSEPLPSWLALCLSGMDVRHPHGKASMRP